MTLDDAEVEKIMRKHTVYVTAGTMAGAIAVAERAVSDSEEHAFNSSEEALIRYEAQITDLQQDLETRIKTIVDLSVANEKLRNQLRDENG